MRTRQQSQETGASPARPPPPPPPPQAAVATPRGNEPPEIQQQQQQQQPPQQPQQPQQPEPQVPPPQQQEPPPAPPQALAAPVEVATQTVPRNWILRVQPPRRDREVPRLLQLHVGPETTALQLALSLQQILGSSDTTIVGLFCQANGVFVSLEHILADASWHKQVFCLIPSAPPPAPPEPIPWWQRIEFWLIVVVIPIGLAMMWVYDVSTRLAVLAYELAQLVYNTTIQWPLEELYRHGPWFLGWEGDSLARICARITFHGDAAFWERNLAECQRIYGIKQEAWLRVARPIAYLVAFLAILLLVRVLVWEVAFAKRHVPPRPPTDRDMVETYRAFQVLLRQVRRATLAADAQPARPAARDHVRR